MPATEFTRPEISVEPDRPIPMAGQGWDGNFGGIAEPSNVFIWTCHYQLEGEEKKMEKGTVLLVR